MDGDWTLEEVEEYMKIRKKELGPIYTEQNIPIFKPQMRLDFLAERIFNFSEEDIEIIKKGSNIKDKPRFLKLLEEMAIDKFY